MNPVAQVLRILLGALLGVAAVALVWHGYPDAWRTSASDEGPAARHRRQELQPGVPSATAVATAASTAPAPAAADCGFDALLPAATPRDGRFRLEPPGAQPRRGDPQAFVRVAVEAAREGRSRDAETALIVACRVSLRMWDVPTVRHGDILRALGEHYALAASLAPSDEARAALGARARDLVARAEATYRTVLGAHAAKTRHAVRLRESLAATVQPARAAASPPRSPTDGVPGRAADLVSADPELATLETDLRRLRAQAEAVSEDPAGLRSRSAQARAERERCRDRACLLDWYARRRRDLLSEF